MIMAPRAVFLFLTAGALGLGTLPATVTSAPGDAPDRIARVEDGWTIRFGQTDPPVRLGLEEIMKLFKVPGVSVAVIDNFKIAWAKGYGVTEAGGTVPVTPRTLFQAGSVSKAVAAVGAMVLVERGAFRLDEDVNTRLTSWKVPQSEFSKEQRVTLRRLVSHTAGLTTRFFPGYAVGEPVPTLVQVLNGEKPANTPPVRVDVTPGSIWRYSGGGTLVEQQLMMDVTGKNFPELMRETVFDKLGMEDSTYEQPLPAARTAQAASGTLATGHTVPGKWHVYPEMATGGLWTTPSDLARLAIEVALARHGESRRVLSPEIARQMLTPQVERVPQGTRLGNVQHPDRMGLGFFLGDAAHADLFGHFGDDAGFQAMVFTFADSGRGVAIMSNSENGIFLGDHLVASIAREYGWDGYVPPDRPRLAPGAILSAAAHSRGIGAAIDAFRQLKKATSPEYVADGRTLNAFVYWLRGENRVTDAVRAAQLQVAEYPDDSNAYDTLAEMYAQAGQKSLAIENYKRSIALNPKNENGVRMLTSLERSTTDPRDSRQAVKKEYACPPCGLDCDKLRFDKPGTCPHCGMTLVEVTAKKPVTVLVLLFNGVQIIDYSGPWEVFGQARFSVHSVAARRDPIKTTFGQRVVPEYTLEDSPQADILVVPGGAVSDQILSNKRVIQWIQATAKDANYVMSVCTGAFLLAKAGLLDGQTATTFHRSIDGLARSAPKARIVHDQRFDNGKVITTAGLTSGIDGALHVVARIKGLDAARLTALGLEYRWEPNSDYARAAFADWYLPRFGGDMKVVAADGDRTHWETRMITSGKSASKILDRIGQGVVSRTPHTSSAVTLTGPETNGAGPKPQIEWRFTGDQGGQWHGVAVAEPFNEQQGEFIVTIKLKRQG
jgi:CubicO group peptidase (beta-lactamase class C family)/putative intracellular protease/amidase